MSKIEKKEWISFVDNGQKYMICKSCQSNYVKCGEKTIATTCSMCVIRMDMMKFPETIKKQKVSSGKPTGWHFMNEYVDKNGNVFHKGKEQPKLKGTLKPTKVKPLKKRKKLTGDEKLQKDLKNWKKRLKAKRGNK